MVAKRSSPIIHARSSASASDSKNFCFAQAITIHPSAVWKFWNGTTDGCAEFLVRIGSQPRDRCHVVTYMSRLSAVSNSDTSTSQPMPSRCARHSALISPSAAAYPVARSTSDSPLFTGGPSGSPVRLIHPAMPCST